MKIIKLIIRNVLRHNLRSMLTILGISIAVMFFGVLRPVVDAWHSGVDASANNRLITRHAVSFIFTLPYSYKEQIARVPGVSGVTFASWFQGVYIDQNQFFARMAVDAETFFDAYPEFLVDKTELENFKKERNACILGEKIAKQYNLKIGDVMPIEGDIYPGKYEFVIKGIYKPRNEKTDATQMLFHWTYLDERMKQDQPNRAGQIGWYVVTIDDPGKSAQASKAIDDMFRNSRAETKSETEAAFQQSFVSMSGAIINAMNFVSFVIVGVILLVLGNTMVMTARERTREYAVLKTLGFSKGRLIGLILGESMAISLLGGLVGVFLTFPIVQGIGANIPSGMFPIFDVKPMTLVFASLSAFIVGITAALFPIWRVNTMKIVDGLRHIG
ncbi:MAG: FtsX-like permease family protein [Ignavibacteriales bacterium]|nr:FtsX-like permease family protein [Ignavibacteriales bacterium]